MIATPDYRALLMAQTPEYEARARAVARILDGRDIENVCGELNTIVHHGHAFVGGLNQTAFGAAYYASALIHLIRGGADLEMRWSGTAHDDAYGVMTREGAATPAGLAKQLMRSGGQNLSGTLLLSEGDGTDDLLDKLGTMSKVAEKSDQIYAIALQDRNAAKSLSDPWPRWLRRPAAAPSPACSCWPIDAPSWARPWPCSPASCRALSPACLP